jgi:hypothetical protein
MFYIKLVHQRFPEFEYKELILIRDDRLRYSVIYEYHSQKYLN